MKWFPLLRSPFRKCDPLVPVIACPYDCELRIKHTAVQANPTFLLSLFSVHLILSNTSTNTFIAACPTLPRKPIQILDLPSTYSTLPTPTLISPPSPPPSGAGRKWRDSLGHGEECPSRTGVSYSSARWGMLLLLVGRQFSKTAVGRSKSSLVFEAHITCLSTLSTFTSASTPSPPLSQSGLTAIDPSFVLSPQPPSPYITILFTPSSLSSPFVPYLPPLPPTGVGNESWATFSSANRLQSQRGCCRPRCSCYPARVCCSPSAK